MIYPADIQNIATRYNYFDVVAKVSKIDPEYYKPKHWKISDTGFVTNTWVKFYLDITTLQSYLDQVEAQRANDAVTSKTKFNKAIDFGYKKINTFEEWVGKIVDKYDLSLEAGKYLAVTLDNVSVNISRTPTIIEHNVIGLSNSVKQFFSANSYDITITGLLAGGVSYQQDSDSITKLISILGAGFPVKVSNPELDIIYGIDSIVPFSYNFEQDPRGYHLKTFTLSCKSDDDSDLIVNTV